MAATFQRCAALNSCLPSCSTTKLKSICLIFDQLSPPQAFQRSTATGGRLLAASSAGASAAMSTSNEIMDAIRVFIRQSVAEQPINCNWTDSQYRFRSLMKFLRLALLALLLGS